MYYLRCYEHSNKCLSIVIQMGEVLLSWWVYEGMHEKTSFPYDEHTHLVKLNQF